MNRSRKLNNFEYSKGDIIYWMSRDQRVNDNWSLLFAQDLAKKYNVNLKVIFCLVPKFLGATLRQYDFMLKGLEQVSKSLEEKNIKFDLLVGDPVKKIPEYVKKEGVLITDFDPLKIKIKWKSSIKNKIKIPFYEVDSHNIIPCWIASNKQEFAAYTIRPKINNLLDIFLTKFPKVKKQKINVKNIIGWNKIKKKLELENIDPIIWLKPGEFQAKLVLKKFEKKINSYSKFRNDPLKDATSNLSPYLHFGQICSQTIALKIKNKEFLEELIVRKELADNFCYYNKNYDKFIGFPKWAQKTLNEHKTDKREYTYTKIQFEKALTHDKLWNAAQMQMIKTGKMHGYMRMYWAKKILEWTKTPKQALKIAIYLNDKYEIDGRDPNGYTGIAWSIGGVHDRAFAKREIFGKIRYMNYNGIKSKFNIKEYIKKINKF